MTVTQPEIMLEAHDCAARKSTLVTFDTEQAAIDFIKARVSTHAFHTVPEAPIDGDVHPLLLELLFPTCPHGLSEALCAGYGHYPGSTF